MRVSFRTCVVSAVVAVLTAGCAGTGETLPTPSPTPTNTVAPAPAPTIGADGVSLRSLGFTNGPVDAFSVPRSTVFVTGVDQPNVVTLVLAFPTPADVDRYLHAALPPAGFTITADDEATRTFTFAGYGWVGSFTATGSRSAVRLAPR